MRSPSPEQWKAVEPLVDELIDMDAAERSGFIERSFSHDPELQAWVERLIAGIGNDAFLDTPGAEFLSAALAEPDAPSPADAFIGSVFGPFRVMRMLGEGGMGRVYLAEREGGTFTQRVALKVMSSAVLSEGLRQRFIAEQRALSLLEHPNVARLVDGGVRADGIPWFAMEYVEGTRIDEWCDARRLGIRDRLALFLSVCHAVQAAHQRLVIHRDLKPSNVLVTSDGDVRLLDFGVAKLLSQDPEEVEDTRVDERLFTPEYAAPEQWRHEMATTATDCYALGVMLYQLLCGHRPHTLRNRPRDSWMRVIETERPPAPSARVTSDAASARGTTLEPLRRTLRGDLDAISMHALRPDAAERYQTARELADDVQRYLEAAPVRARQGRWMYRAARFVRRNRLAVGLSGVMLLAIVGGIVATTWQARRAGRAAAEATAVTRFLISLFEQGSPNETRGDSLTAAEMLQRASRGVDSMFPHQPAHRIQVLLAVAGINRELVRLDQADSLARRALALTDTFGLAGLERVQALGMVGQIASARDQLADADTLIRRALQLAREVGAPDTVRARLLDTHASVFFRMDRFREAEIADREALRLGGDLGLVFRALVTGNIAMEIAAQTQSVANSAGRMAESDSLFLATLELYRAAGMADHPDYFGTLASRATLWLDRSRPDSARPLLAAALTGLERVYDPNHERVLAAVNNLAQADLELEHAELAESGFGRSRARALHVYGPDHFLALIPWFNMGKAQLLRMQPREAEASFRGVLGQLKTREGMDARLALGAWLALGRALVAQRRFGDAMLALDSAARLTSGMAPGSAVPSEIALDRATVLIGLGRPREAEALAREAVTWRRANLGEQGKAMADATFTLARAIMAGADSSARRQEAIQLADESSRLLRTIPWPLAARAAVDSARTAWRGTR